VTSLDQLAADLAAAERTAMERYAYVAPRILDVPALRPPFATALRLRLSVLREVRTEVPADWYDRRLAAARRQAETARDRALRTTERLDELLGERRRLRDRLDVYRSYARNKAYERDGTPLEDGELGARYDKAYELLYTGLVDLDRAARHVRSYMDAVRRRFPEENS
jgi:hypothetical protein